MTGSMAGKAGLVTGAVGGIGRACAIRVDAGCPGAIVTPLMTRASPARRPTGVAMPVDAGSVAGW